MVPAVPLPGERNVEGTAAAREEVLARYRQLRAISTVHQDKCLGLVSASAMLQQARRLGMSDGKALFLDGVGGCTLLYDLLVYTAPPGRSRALDRYAQNSPPPAGSDEALVLNAMRNARFAVLKVRSRHPVAGLIFTDLFRDEETWLVDEGLEASLEVGAAFATRYHTPERFSMAAGAGVPVDRGLLADAVEAHAPHLMRKSDAQLINDPRFAEAIYRAVIEQAAPHPRPSP